MPNRRTVQTGLLALVAACGLWPCAFVAGSDWPNILGPRRNGIAVEEKLADKWPTGGPRSLWETKVGSGFAGVAVADGIAVLFTEHDMDVVFTFADRVIVMNRGRIIAQGAPDVVRL